MNLFSRTPKGDLNLNYNIIAGYSVGWLPYSEKAIQLAFPHLKVKAATVPGYGPDTEDGFALFDGDQDEPALCITKDSESGYAFSVTAHNGQAQSLGSYRVGEILLGDFRDDHMEEADFWVDGSKIVVMGGVTDRGAIYGTRHLFLPPDDRTGDLRKAGPDVWRACVLSEIRFFVSGRRIRPTKEIDAADGVKQVKKHRGQAPQPLQPGPNLCDGDPITLLLKGLYSPKEAQKAYLKLADIAIHNGDVATTKAKIKAVFENHNSPEDVALRLSEMYNEERQTVFMFPLDWKEEPSWLASQISAVLGDEAVALPDMTQTSVAQGGVFEAYAACLQDAGFDLWGLDTGSDTHCLFVARKKDRNRITKLMIPTQSNALPWKG
ncbi:DUF6630 family protein [Yoonia sp. 2307UL14-13]|uniref:DUF6630 family protein n=1 Tax=Yoonia sp. 2307UL14-13 TaxID=3126506 RepID=UPI0030A63CFE